MGIKFYCPNGHKMNVKSFLAGQKGVCPRCGVSVEIPLGSVSKAPPPPAPPAAATQTAGGGTKAPTTPKTVFGMVVENPQPGGGAPQSAAHQQPPTSAPQTAAPRQIPSVAAQPIQQSAAGPLEEALEQRWSTSAPSGPILKLSVVDDHPKALPGAAYAHRTRRRTRKEQMATLSLIMLGMVAMLTAILLVMFLSR